MSAAEVLQELEHIGVSVTVDGPELVLKGRTHALAPVFIARILAHKPQLVALLSAPLPEVAAPLASPAEARLAALRETAAAIFALPRAVQAEVWADAARLEEGGVDRLEAERLAVATVQAPGWSGERPVVDRLVRDQQRAEQQQREAAPHTDEQRQAAVAGWGGELRALYGERVAIMLESDVVDVERLAYVDTRASALGVGLGAVDLVEQVLGAVLVEVRPAGTEDEERELPLCPRCRNGKWVKDKEGNEVWRPVPSVWGLTRCAECNMPRAEMKQAA